MNEYDTHYALRITHTLKEISRKRLESSSTEFPLSIHPSITRAFSSFQHNQNHYPTQNAAVSSHNNRSEIPNIPSPNTKVSCSKASRPPPLHTQSSKNRLSKIRDSIGSLTAAFPWNILFWKGLFCHLRGLWSSQAEPMTCLTRFQVFDIV